MFRILTSFKFSEVAHDELVKELMALPNVLEMFLLSDENINEHLRTMLYSP